MSLWVDKYRHTNLEQFELHVQINQQLKALAQVEDFPHILMYGPSGAGKKTRIMAVLKEIFGDSVEKLKMDARTFKTASDKKFEIMVISSNYHIEVTPSDVGHQDRIVIQELIKDIAQTKQLSSFAHRTFKVVVINEADSLTKDAQHALRRTMEKYMSNMRIILCCSSTSKIIAPIKSRCLLIRIPLPSHQEIMGILHSVAKKENVNLPEKMAMRISEASERNVRKALLILESSKVRHYPFFEGQEIEIPDWEKFIADIAHMITREEQSTAKLLQVRGKMYELLTHCIPPSTIIKILTFELMKRIDGQLKPELARQAAFYEHRIQNGSKAIFHLEAFVAKFMSIYKRYLMDVCG